MSDSETGTKGGVFGFCVKAILFDMDGVLVDSERLHKRADAEVFVAHGLSVPNEAWDDIFGMRAEEGLRFILDRYGNGDEDASALADEKRERYFELVRQGLDPISGVKEFVVSCCERSLRTGVVTSGRAYYQLPILDRFGFRPLFDVIVTGDEVMNGKPDPEPYLLAVSRLGLDPAECIVVEDADNGIRSAKAAGCIAVGLSTSLSRERLLAAGADLVIDGFIGY
ncbi:MAG TPA: HAD family phosphatase [Candidatus Fimivivens sp.]|nr:HAD family phosphatase [Candidatus Fimivivens sp.]